MNGKMIEIDIQTLKEIKRGLLTFRENIQGTTENVVERFEKDKDACATKINDAKAKLENLKSQLTNVQAEYNRIKEQLIEKEEKLEFLQRHLRELENELKYEKESTDRDNGNGGSGSKAEKLSNEIAITQKEIRKVSSDVEDLVDKEKKAFNEQERLKNEVKSIDRTVQTLQNDFNKIKVQGELIVTSVRNLESSANDATERGSACLTQCIFYLNDYIGEKFDN